MAVVAEEVTRLKRWRVDKGLTLEEVAGLVGMSTAMLSLAERRLRKLSPMAKVKLARSLAVPVHLLFEPPEDPEPLEAAASG
jgi:transcriptional regulator with XRE-family HTH domain